MNLSRHSTYTVWMNRSTLATKFGGQWGTRTGVIVLASPSRDTEESEKRAAGHRRLYAACSDDP
jgi:hypothetical protein